MCNTPGFAFIVNFNMMHTLEHLIVLGFGWFEPHNPRTNIRAPIERPNFLGRCIREGVVLLTLH